MRQCWLRLGVVSGIIVTVLGVFLLLGFPAILISVIHNHLHITEGSFAFRMWQSPPVPIYMDVYFFNVSNPKAFVQHGAKPVLVETGPYTYRVWLNREDVHWHPNGTVSFRLTKTYNFMRNMSVGSEEDAITTLNAPMVILAALMQNSSSWEKIALSAVLSLLGEDLFITRTVGELLFHGYPNILTLLGPVFIPALPNTNGHFGWLYGKNGTDEGVLTAFTGERNLDRLNVVSMWNGQSTIPFWNGSPCNDIHGTDGVMNPPVVNRKQEVSLFYPEMCRMWVLQQGKENQHRGIDSRRFSPAPTFLANGTDNPENACFYTGRHLLSGAMDISPCRYGAPIILSFPHFYLADPAYLSNVVGLKPNATFHQFYLDVEPMTGLAMELGARLQINLMLEKVRGIRQFENIPELVFPILWQALRAEVTESIADQLKNEIFRPEYDTMIVGYCFVAIGVVATVCALTACMISKRNKLKDEKQLLEASDESAEDDGGVTTNGYPINGHHYKDNSAFG